MPRSREPATVLGVAVRERRGKLCLRACCAEIGVSRRTFLRAEYSNHYPHMRTAKALAAWLGWSPDQVMDAAITPSALMLEPDEARDPLGLV